MWVGVGRRCCFFLGDGAKVQKWMAPGELGFQLPLQGGGLLEGFDV